MIKLVYIYITGLGCPLHIPEPKFNILFFCPTTFLPNYFFSSHYLRYLVHPSISRSPSFSTVRWIPYNYPLC